MISLKQIYLALTNRQYAELELLSEEAAYTSIENCDSAKRTILLDAMREASIYEGVSDETDRRLIAVLEAIEKGRHPYEDAVTMDILNIPHIDKRDRPRPGSG